MPVPKFIKLGTYNLAVKTDQANWDKLKLEGTNAHDKVGFYKGQDETIHIAPGQSLNYERDTVLHEVLHGIVAQAGSLQAMDFTDDMEENLILLMTPWLLMVLQDNPDLVEYLTT